VRELPAGVRLLQALHGRVALFVADPSRRVVREGAHSVSPYCHACDPDAHARGASAMPRLSRFPF